MANRAFTRVSRRKTQWFGIGSSAGGVGPNPPVAIASGGVSILSQAFIASGSSGALEEEVTITRMIGEILVASNDTTAEEAAFAIGCIVARNEAVAAGVASLASPSSDPDAEWVYYVAGGVVQEEAAPIGSFAEVARVPFDVRGQRIVRAGSTVVWIAQAVSGPLFMSVNGRYLTKLT